MNVKRFFNNTISNGGATFSVEQNQYKTGGYAVATSGNEVVIPLDRFNQMSIVKYIDRFRHKLGGNFCLGSWVNDGKVYLDISEIETQQETAVIKAKQRNQLAIFNLDTFEEIDTREV